MKKQTKKINVSDFFIGAEPVWGDPKKEMGIIPALSWYSNQMSPKESKQYTLDYIKSNDYSKDIVQKLSSSQDWLFGNLGFVCRMIQRGAKLDKIDWINKRINEIINRSDVESTEEEQTTTKSDKTIQDRIFDQATTYINEIEGHVDLFIKNRKTDFKCYDWLKSNEIKPIYISQIKNHYSPLLDELNSAFKKEDEQLVESYSHWNKKDLTAFIKFIESVLEDCTNYTNNTKTVRKTRKKKAVPLEKKVANVKFKKEDSEYKIVSVNPTEIISAKQVWVFNSKYKTLGVYNSIDESGLSIKGTTITGFNETNSIQKTLRKPTEVLPLVTKGKKTELKKVLTNLSTKEQSLNGRLNEEIVILKVIK